MKLICKKGTANTASQIGNKVNNRQNDLVPRWDRSPYQSTTVDHNHTVLYVIVGHLDLNL